MNLAIDLFTGSGSFEKVARTLNYEVISIDIRRRKGTCEPTLKVDITNLNEDIFKSLKPKIIWAGIPCDIWSNASGGFHLDENFNPKTQKAVEHIKILNKTLAIIKKSTPDFYFIENPRGKLNKYPGLLKFLEETNGSITYCTLSSYGFKTTKPTMIATNFKKMKLKKMDNFGRGAKNNIPGTFDNTTKTQRQETPKKLIIDILKQIQL